MLTNKSKKLTLTLVASLVFILSLSPVYATSDFQAVHRRNHGYNRLIKKRSPQKGVLGDIIGESSTTASTATTSAPTAATATTTPATTTLLRTSSSATSSSTSSSVSQSVPSSSSSASSSASSSSSSSASSSSSSSASSTSVTGSSSTSSSSSTGTTTSATTTTPESVQVTQAPPQETEIVTTKNGVKVTITQTAGSAQQTEPTTQSGAAGNNNKAKSTALTVLIVIASSVGAVLLIWTIFRKWKLARSSKFDERLQPIDWQPTSADEGIIPANRRRYSNASSFRSGITGNGGYGATSAVGHGSSDHGHRGGMEHDFTTGPSSHLAPVGGYADLARGPSPGPMQELSRGPSLSRPNYDVGVPLHHQTPYGRY